jgi:hypothetical protein
MPPLVYLSFEVSEGTDGVRTIDAEAATTATQASQVQAEVQQVLDWAWRTFPRTHGPVDQGFDWDHDVQTALAGGGTDGQGWHTTALTISASAAFAEAFAQRFAEALN